MLIRNLTILVCAGCLLSFGSPRMAAKGSVAPLPIPGGDLIPCPCTGKRVDRSSSTSFCQGRGSTARTPSLTASRTSTEPSRRSTWAGMRSTVRLQVCRANHEGNAVREMA